MTIKEESIYDDLLEGEDNTPIDEPDDGIEGSPEGEEQVQEGNDQGDNSNASTKVDEPFLTVKHLDNEQNLTREQAIEYAQKGMDYDRVREKYDEMKPYKDDIDRVREFARTTNKSVPEFLEAISQAQLNYEIGNELQNLKNQYPDADENLIKEFARSRVESRHAETKEKAMRAEEEQREALQKAQQEEVHRDVELFKKEFPGVDLKNIDPQVLEYIKDGMSLVSAYYKYQSIKQKPITDAQVKASQQNELNKAKDLGAVNTSGEGEADDPFMQGFNSVK